MSTELTRFLKPRLRNDDCAAGFIGVGILLGGEEQQRRGNRGIDSVAIDQLRGLDHSLSAGSPGNDLLGGPGDKGGGAPQFRLGLKRGDDFIDISDPVDRPVILFARMFGVAGEAAGYQPSIMPCQRLGQIVGI